LKAVVYHADARYADGNEVGNTYKRLFKGFNANCRQFNCKTVHVTLEGHEGWGDENFYVSGLDPKNVMLNREIAFAEFLKQAPEDLYLFSEPDYRMWKAFPALRGDVSLLYRAGDDVPMNPAWRLATPKALPLFELLRDETQKVKLRPGVGYDWHCDSEGFTSAWKLMGSPKGGMVEFLGLRIEFRDFSQYIKPNPIYGRNYAWHLKHQLLQQEGL
jgi:hypothetical protein